MATTPITLIGTASDDIHIVSDSTTVIIEQPGDGTDLVQTSVNHTLPDNVENITITGNNALTAFGNSVANILTSNNAASTLVELAGDDQYIISNSTTVVTEVSNAGTDLIESSVTYTLPDNIENLTLTGGAAINGTGNTLANTLTGNSAANSLTGLARNDTIDGKAGADTMVGGSGMTPMWLTTLLMLSLKQQPQGLIPFNPLLLTPLPQTLKISASTAQPQSMPPATRLPTP